MCGATRNSDTPSNPGTGSGPVTYPPTVSAASNGSVSVSPERPRSGDTVTVKPQPDDGYTVGKMVVKDSNGNQLDVKDNGDGTYSFIQPAGSVTIEVTFVFVCTGDDDCPSRAFTDLNTNAWYHEAVDYAIRNGLMKGYGNQIFGPNNTLSRAMLAQILYNREGRPQTEYALDFTDVPSGAWYNQAVRWAAAKGIVFGYGGGKFGPNDPVTREQLAAVLYRYAKTQGGDFTGNPSLSPNFSDVSSTSAWAYEAVAWCAMNGILNCYSDGTLRPKGQATRAEAAAMLIRYFELNK